MSPRFRVWLLLLPVAAVAAISCAAPPRALPEAPPSPQPPAALVYDQLRNAFRITDRSSRRAVVSALTSNFLADIAARQVDDLAASALMTDIATASQTAVTSEPAIIRRQGQRAIVSFPDGLGLYLYDLQAPLNASPLELSTWTIGLNSIQVTWQFDEVGVAYTTVAADRSTLAHFVLAEKVQGKWQVDWFSDEDADWWFNAHNASLTVSPDLKTIDMVGEAEYSTPAFDERAGTPHRLFMVEWRRQQSSYELTPPPGPDSTRTMWLWGVALPSPYATLVEFIERMRINDMTGAAKLVASPRVVADAFAFGLDFPENRFLVTASDANTITFRSIRGAFLATFKPPDSGAAGPWLIASLRPVGAAPPTPQPGQ